MSMSAKYHARLWATNKTQDQIVAEIARLQAMPSVKGMEFDDHRVTHMHQTFIETLRSLIQ